MPSRSHKILDAAEHAFAESGFAGASLRNIVRVAKVNLATVYYYFGSKTGLMEAVLKRRLGPLRQEHLERLRQAESEAGDGPVSVEKILEAMLMPPLRIAAQDSIQRQAVTRLIGRIVSEPSDEIQNILHQQRAEVRQAFVKALQRSLPRVHRVDLLWRMEFVWGALTFILCNPKKIEKDTQGECIPDDASKVLNQMIQFFSPGFSSVSPTEPGPSHPRREISHRAAKRSKTR